MGNENGDHVAFHLRSLRCVSCLCRLPRSTPVQKGLVAHRVEEDSGAQGSNMSMPHSWKWRSWDSNPETRGETPSEVGFSAQAVWSKPAESSSASQVFCAGRCRAATSQAPSAPGAADGQSAPSGFCVSWVNK